MGSKPGGGRRGLVWLARIEVGDSLEDGVGVWEFQVWFGGSDRVADAVSAFHFGASEGIFDLSDDDEG